MAIDGTIRFLGENRTNPYAVHPPAEDTDEHVVPFTDDELKILWANKEDPVVEFMLIMCFSGYHIIAMSVTDYRNAMYDKLAELGIEKHTPHDCRHTFSRLCEKYEVNENDRKRMMGHSFGDDITNKIYGHRTIEEFREQIEKIRICDYLVSSKTK